MALKNIPILLGAGLLASCATKGAPIRYEAPVAAVCSVSGLVKSSIALGKGQSVDQIDPCLPLALQIKLDEDFAQLDARLAKARVAPDSLDRALISDLDILGKDINEARIKGLNVSGYLQAFHQRRPEVLYVTSQQYVSSLEKRIIGKAVTSSVLEGTERYLDFAESQGVNVKVFRDRFRNMKIIGLRQIAEQKLVELEVVALPPSKEQLDSLAVSIAALAKEGVTVGDLLRRFNALKKVRKPCLSKEGCHMASFEPDANGGPATGPTLLP